MIDLGYPISSVFHRNFRQHAIKNDYIRTAVLARPTILPIYDAHDAVRFIYIPEDCLKDET